MTRASRRHEESIDDRRPARRGREAARHPGQVAEADRSAARRRREGDAGRRAATIPCRRSRGSTRRSRAIEAELEPAPMYDAPYWQGSGKLEGKVALITGGDSGHRPGGGGALRARGRGRGDRLPRRGRRRRGDAQGAVEAEGRRGDPDRRATCGPRLLPGGGRPRRSKSSAGSTSWSTTPPSRCTREDFDDLTRGALRRDAEDQPLRLFLPGPGGGAAHEAGLGDHQHRLGHRHRRRRRSSSTTR